jgi:hypothetical protein
LSSGCSTNQWGTQPINGSVYVLALHCSEPQGRRRCGAGAWQLPPGRWLQPGAEGCCPPAGSSDTMARSTSARHAGQIIMCKHSRQGMKQYVVRAGASMVRRCHGSIGNETSNLFVRIMLVVQYQLLQSRPWPAHLSSVQSLRAMRSSHATGAAWNYVHASDT